MSSLPILDFAVQAIPHVPIDRGVQQATTGRLAQDILPLLSMWATLPTLVVFFAKRRYCDVFSFGLGFLLAVIYHVAHLDGLEESSVFGVSGSLWRSLDILVAQSLLARTLGHALGARSAPAVWLSNGAFPTLLMSWAVASKRIPHIVPPMTLGQASRALLAVMCATLLAKLVLEGPGTLPKYNKARGRRAGLCFLFGFVVFPLPELFPEKYWLCHSLWHCFIAIGYYELYNELLVQDAMKSNDQKLRRQTHGKPFQASDCVLTKPQFWQPRGARAA
jgi:hypothetical protein